MPPAVASGMHFLGVVTVFIGLITMILTNATMLLLPYTLLQLIHLANLFVSIIVLSVGVSCHYASQSPNIASTKYQLGKANIFLGCILLFAFLIGVVLPVHASGAYKDQSEQLQVLMPDFPSLDQMVLDQALLHKDCPQSLPETCSKRLKQRQDLEQAIQRLKSSSFVRCLEYGRALWAVIHGLHAANGVVILLTVIFVAATWFHTTVPKRDPEREPVTISQHCTSANDASQTEKVYEKVECHVETAAA